MKVDVKAFSYLILKKSFPRIQIFWLNHKKMKSNTLASGFVIGLEIKTLIQRQQIKVKSISISAALM